MRIIGHNGRYSPYSLMQLLIDSMRAASYPQEISTRLAYYDKRYHVSACSKVDRWKVGQDAYGGYGKA